MGRGRKNYDDEKADEEHKVVHILTVVALVILFGSLLMITLLQTIQQYKLKFVKERYGVELENFCVSSQDGKLDMLNTIANAFHYKKSEIAIVDDYWYQLDRAADGGFQAYFPIQIVNYMNQ